MQGIDIVKCLEDKLEKEVAGRVGELLVLDNCLVKKFDSPVKLWPKQTGQPYLTKTGLPHAFPELQFKYAKIV